MTEPDANRIAGLQRQVIYWRNEARALNQLLQASRNTPEHHTGRSIIYPDPTGNRAAAVADKTNKRRKGNH